MSRIRLILFDAFDTLITPRLPIHVQYAQEAHKYGLPAHIITPDSVRAAFKPSFKKITAQYPEWGRTARPAMTPSDWWILCIEETMRTAGAEEGKLREVMPRLGKALLDRFESAEGYRAFDDVVPCCRTVTRLKAAGVKTGLVSNADDRILKTLDALEITPLLTAGTTISQLAGFEKPDPRIFEAACRRAGVEPRDAETRYDGVLMIGDELEADYHGSLRAGLEPRLIRRPGDFSDGAKRVSEEEERETLSREGIKVIRSLDEIVKEVQQRSET